MSLSNSKNKRTQFFIQLFCPRSTSTARFMTTNSYAIYSANGQRDIYWNYKYPIFVHSIYVNTGNPTNEVDAIIHLYKNGSLVQSFVPGELTKNVPQKLLLDELVKFSNGDYIRMSCQDLNSTNDRVSVTVWGFVDFDDISYNYMGPQLYGNASLAGVKDRFVLYDFQTIPDSVFFRYNIIPRDMVVTGLMFGRDNDTASPNYTAYFSIFDPIDNSEKQYASVSIGNQTAQIDNYYEFDTHVPVKKGSKYLLSYSSSVDSNCELGARLIGYINYPKKNATLANKSNKELWTTIPSYKENISSTPAEMRRNYHVNNVATYTCPTNVNLKSMIVHNYQPEGDTPNYNVDLYVNGSLKIENIQTSSSGIANTVAIFDLNSSNLCTLYQGDYYGYKIADANNSANNSAYVYFSGEIAE